MSLMQHSIRPKIPEEDTDQWNPEEIYRKEWKDYNLTFCTQRKLMKKEIGCSFDVKGHIILLKAINLPSSTSSGLMIPESVINDIITKYNIGLVIGIGPEAYRDKERFPLGPRCKVGDWIDFRRFEKDDKWYNDHRCYIIDDDRVYYPITDIKDAVTELRKWNFNKEEKE